AGPGGTLGLDVELNASICAAIPTNHDGPQTEIDAIVGRRDAVTQPGLGRDRVDVRPAERFLAMVTRQQSGRLPGRSDILPCRSLTLTPPPSPHRGSAAHSPPPSTPPRRPLPSRAAAAPAAPSPTSAPPPRPCRNARAHSRTAPAPAPPAPP